MKKYISQVLLILSVIFIPVLLMSCAEDLITQPDNKYNGDNQVMFKPISNTVDGRADINEPPVKVSPEIQLVSAKGLLGDVVKIEVAVDDSSTAVANVDYKIVSPLPFTIASGKASEHLEIEVMADGLAEGDSKELYLTLKEASVGGASVTIAKNYKTYTLIIRGKN